MYEILALCPVGKFTFFVPVWFLNDEIRKNVSGFYLQAQSFMAGVDNQLGYNHLYIVFLTFFLQNIRDTLICYIRHLFP